MVESTTKNSLFDLVKKAFLGFLLLGFFNLKKICHRNWMCSTLQVVRRLDDFVNFIFKEQ